jgi:type I restriction enzyme S subunit
MSQGFSRSYFAHLSQELGQYILKAMRQQQHQKLHLSDVLGICRSNVSEQRAIAAALSDVDALIASLDKLIAKKRDIKQAAMQQLLTGNNACRSLVGTGR